MPKSKVSENKTLKAALVEKKKSEEVAQVEPEKLGFVEIRQSEQVENDTESEKHAKIEFEAKLQLKDLKENFDEEDKRGGEKDDAHYDENFNRYSEKGLIQNIIQEKKDSPKMEHLKRSMKGLVNIINKAQGSQRRLEKRNEVLDEEIKQYRLFKELKAVYALETELIKVVMDIAEPITQRLNDTVQRLRELDGGWFSMIGKTTTPAEIEADKFSVAFLSLLNLTHNPNFTYLLNVISKWNPDVLGRNPLYGIAERDQPLSPQGFDSLDAKQSDEIPASLRDLRDMV